jgi:hypothetical protein
MALSITIEGKGVIANCDALTNDTGGTGTGDWTEEGGGTMSLTPDVFLYSTSSIAGKYANKDGFQQFDIGAGNELDFSSGGTEEDQFLYIWINMAAFAVLDDISTGGLFIRVSSSSPGTSNYLDYCIAGGNQLGNGVSSNGWTGGWKLFVVDPTKPPTRSNGTQSSIIASVRTLGIYLETWDSVRAESVFIDQMAVGKGLRIVGISPSGWEEVVNYCTKYDTRAWGMMQELDGIYYAYGTFYIGDSTQTKDTVFRDSGRIIQFGTSQYYNGTEWKTTFPSGAAGIVVEDAASYKTVFQDGILVGDDAGRAGSTYIGNDDQHINLDLYAGGNNIDSSSCLYGTTLKSLYGLIESDGVDLTRIYSTNVIDCEVVKAAQSAVIRNSLFAECASASGALMWYPGMDIADCSFIANTNGAAITYPLSSGTTWNNLLFSGNTYDINNTGGSSITITKGGTTDASTYTGDTVTFQASLDITITVQDADTNLLQGILVGIYKTSDRTELLNQTTDVNGEATTSYTGGTPVDVEIRARKASSGGTRYKNFSTLASLTGDFELLVTMIEDTVNNATT